MTARRRAAAPLTRERAWSYALWLLGRQALSAADVERRLLRRGLDADGAAATVARLRELALLDDAAFAATYVRSRARDKGALALRHELARRGVAEAHVDAALDDVDDPVRVAVGVLERNAWRFAAADDPDPAAAQRARRRALAFLARRGFPHEAVIDAFERWRAERVA